MKAHSQLRHSDVVCRVMRWLGYYMVTTNNQYGLNVELKSILGILGCYLVSTGYQKSNIQSAIIIRFDRHDTMTRDAAVNPASVLRI